MKLKFAQYTPFEMGVCVISFFVKIKIFRFWPKTMDYSQAFCPKSRSLFVAFLLHSGRCYEAEICAFCSF